MTETYDFEQSWLAKFSDCLGEIAGEGVRRVVMEGSEGMATDSSRREVIAWTQRAMERLEAQLGEETSREVMVGCACQYPKSGLQEARQAYEATGDVGAAHRVLQEQFEAFLRRSLALSQELIEGVIARGWGLAGIRHGERIIATKIPKSRYLAAYMEETDPEKRRQYYCHCPRIRDVLKTSETLSAIYCYCGAGFYKGIWEEIVQRPVEVEVLESVLAGDEVCKIEVFLPAEGSGERAQR